MYFAIHIHAPPPLLRLKRSSQNSLHAPPTAKPFVTQHQRVVSFPVIVPCFPTYITACHRVSLSIQRIHTLLALYDTNYSASLVYLHKLTIF